MRVQAVSHRKRERLGDGQVRDAHEDLIHELSELAGATGAAVSDRLAHVGEQGAGSVEGLLVAADHDGERGVSRADVAAADRRVEHPRALCRQRVGHLARRGGGDG